MRTRLTVEEIKMARDLWRDLLNGVSNAHEQLNQAPDIVRTAILNALALSVDQLATVNKPFGSCVRNDAGLN